MAKHLDTLYGYPRLASQEQRLALRRIIEGREFVCRDKEMGNVKYAFLKMTEVFTHLEPTSPGSYYLKQLR